MPVKGKQKDFVQYYEDIASETRHNASASYAEAYGRSNDATARVNAAKLLTKANIKQAIAEYGREIAAKVDVKRDEIIQALRLLAGLDKGVGKVENRDKLSSLKLLGQTLVMFADKVVIDTAGQAELDARAELDADRILNAIRKEGAGPRRSSPDVPQDGRTQRRA